MSLLSNLRAISLYTTFQIEASTHNQISISFRVLDQLAEAKAKRKEEGQGEDGGGEGGYVFQSSDQLLQV